MILAQFQHTGHTMAALGLIYSQSGNVSIRNDSRQLCITRKGCVLGSLADGDLITTGIYQDDRFSPLASSELEVHRAIYMKTNAQAIVHAHPVHTIALSFSGKEIIPCDIEGQLRFSRVPVIGDESRPVRPGEFAGEIADVLSGTTIAVVRGHGSFAIGSSLEEALGLTVTLEQCCRILYLRKSMGL